MSDDIRVILYSTDYCSLCEQALDLLLSMPELAGRQLGVVDVASDETLQVRYGHRLPVLELTNGGAREELDWPFAAPTVAALVAALISELE